MTKEFKKLELQERYNLRMSELKYRINKTNFNKVFKKSTPNNKEFHKINMICNMCRLMQLNGAI